MEPWEHYSRILLTLIINYLLFCQSVIYLVLFYKCLVFKTACVIYIAFQGIKNPIHCKNCTEP